MFLKLRNAGITIVVLMTFVALISILLTGFFTELLLCSAFVVTLMLVARPLQLLASLRHRFLFD